MNSSPHNRWMFGWAVFTAAATLGLIALGGLVTSHEAGLAVPDWPTTYGYNMFFFPISKWTGGIFYEHTHRLWASAVGLFTVILAVWLWLADPRRWVRWLGVVAVFGVIAQGVLGGVRVVALKDEIGIFHGTLAQLFLVLVSSLALITSKWWHNVAGDAAPAWVSLRRLFTGVSVMVLLQLALGATMRHQHAGLAISDFPLAHGSLWPATDAESILQYNQVRGEVLSLKPITAFHVWLHMAHRLLAVVILSAVGWAVWRTFRTPCAGNLVRRLALGWLGLVLTQFILGAATVWTNKSADIATAHVVCGALTLVTGSLLALMACRCQVSVFTSTLRTATAPLDLVSTPAPHRA